MRRGTPTSALLERVEKHIDRLDRALKESEDLLASVRRIDREEWIRQLYERLAAASRRTTPSAQGEPSERPDAPHSL